MGRDPKSQAHLYFFFVFYRPSACLILLLHQSGHPIVLPPFLEDGLLYSDRFLRCHVPRGLGRSVLPMRSTCEFPLVSLTLVWRCEEHYWREIKLMVGPPLPLRSKGGSPIKISTHRMTMFGTLPEDTKPYIVQMLLPKFVSFFN